MEGIEKKERKDIDKKCFTGFLGGEGEKKSQMRKVIEKRGKESRREGEDECE